MSAPSTEDNIALRIRDLTASTLSPATSTGGGCAFLVATSVGRLDEVEPLLGGADAIFFDGTFWSDDELRDLKIGADTAHAMGHLPVGGCGGSGRGLAELPARTKLYVHVNNTNPLLDPASRERAWIASLGLEVGYDGWTMTL